MWPNGVQPIAPKAPPTLPRGPRMSARVTPPLAVHRPPVFRCACTVTGPPRGVSPAKVTALCAVARVVIGTVNLDFFGFFFIFSGTVEIWPQRGTAWPGPARVARPAGAEVAGFARSRGATWPGPARARTPSFARKGAASERARVASGVSRALFIVGIRCIVENRA